MTPEEVRALAEKLHGEHLPGEGPDAMMFILLVDVADAYVKELEKQAGQNAAPFFTGLTPMEAALNGLRENLEIIRQPHLMGWEVADPDED